MVYYNINMTLKIQVLIKFFNLFSKRLKKSSHCEDPALDAGDVGRIGLHFVRNDNLRYAIIFMSVTIVIIRRVWNFEKIFSMS
jgi:hypothetical protein